MTEEKRYIETATEELLNPTFETTKQHIEVLEVQTENEKPEIARVTFSDDLVSIYFKVKGEKFFLVINVTKDEKPEPAGTWVESGHRIFLTATSEKLSFQELKELLNLNPVTGWSNGEKRPNGKSEYTFSRISFEPNENEAYDLEEKLSELLSEIEKDINGVLRLVENSDACISVCRHQYVSGNAGVHFDLKTIDRLQQLRLPVDIDTFIVGKELKE